MIVNGLIHSSIFHFPPSSFADLTGEGETLFLLGSLGRLLPVYPTKHRPRGLWCMASSNDHFIRPPLIRPIFHRDNKNPQFSCELAIYNKNEPPWSPRTKKETKLEGRRRRRQTKKGHKRRGRRGGEKGGTKEL